MSAPTPLRPLGWLIGMLAAFPLSTGLAIASIVGLTNELEISRGTSRLNLGAVLDAKLRAISRAKEESPAPRIVLFGDSTVVAYPIGRQLPARLQARLNADRDAPHEITVHGVAHPGVGAFSFYYLADSLARSNADLIIVETSFTHYTDRWMQSNDRSQLAGWLGMDRLLASLHMPLMRNGLQLDRQLLYQGIVELRLVPEWRAVREAQSRVNKLRIELERRLDDYFDPLPEQEFARKSHVAKRRYNRLPGRPRRPNAIAAGRFLRATLDGLDTSHPALVVLEAGLHRLQRSGIPVIVYLNPINLEHLDDLGLLDPRLMQQSVAAVRSIVEGTGAHFLDAHDAFEDHNFTDGLGHFFDRGEIDSPGRLLDQLEPEVRAYLESER